MKLTLCTLAICLSILASVLTTKALIREESKRIRSSFAKTAADSDGLQNQKDPVIQKLEAINAQLTALNRRLSLLEEGIAGKEHAADGESLRSTLQNLTKRTDGVTASLTKLDGVPDLLSELTAYIDQSFEHLEETVTTTASPEKLAAQLEAVERRLAIIDSYFTPLYAFLGLVYDPKSDDVLAAYPTIDARITALSGQLETLRKDIADLREWLVPRTFDPNRRVR